MIDFEVDDSLTVIAPLVPGVALSVTSPLAAVPPGTDAGVMPREITWNGLTVNSAVFAIPLHVSVIVTVCSDVTSLCVTTNVAVLAPLATFTLPGTVTNFVLELLSVTVSPEAAASPLNVTVPVTVVLEPPTTGFGVNDRL